MGAQRKSPVIDWEIQNGFTKVDVAVCLKDESNFKTKEDRVA